MSVKVSLKVKFYRHTLVPNENGCMLWRGQLSEKGLKGYGRIKHTSNKWKAAHRFSYELYNGPIPEGMLVLHKCDIPRCVAPDHLLLGTQSENMIDMHKKNRHSKPQAENNCNAKLKNSDVKKIKDLRKAGLTYEQLAKLANVSPACIAHIFQGRSYKSLI